MIIIVQWHKYKSRNMVKKVKIGKGRKKGY